LEDRAVRALFRAENDNSRRWADAGCEVLVGDLRDRDSLKRLVAGADVVIHCAAKIMGFAPEEFDEVNVQGTKSLLDAAIEAGCRRFVYISSIAVYGGGVPTEDGEYLEGTPLQAGEHLDAYTRTKILAESAVVDACARSELEYVILRPTSVYGPQISSWTRLPLDMIKKGRRLFVGFDEPEGLLDVVYVEDLVQAILLAIQNPRAANEVFTIGGETVTFKALYALLGAMVDRAPRLGTETGIRRIASMMRRLPRFWPAAGEIERGMETAVRMSLNRCRYPSTKAMERLGYAPRFVLPTGMLRTELALRDAGVLAPRKRPIPNADQHYRFCPKAVIRPETEEQIVDAVREAQARGLPVKAIGALHSFVPIPATDGICVSLERYRRVIAVDGTRATVQSGITIAELNAALRGYRLVLPVNGFYTAQTVAGAVSTATHGGSLHHGTLADQVEEIRIVRPDGTIAEVGSGHEDFHAVVTSLGLLGIVSTLTLKCVPEFYLRSEARVCVIEQLFAEFDSIQRQNDFVDVLYHPQTRQVKMLLMNRVDAPPDERPLQPTESVPPSYARKKLVSFTFRSLLRVLNATRSESMNRAIVNRVIGTLYPCGGTRRSDEALTFGDLSAVEPFPIDDMEFAVPYDRAVGALQELSDLFERERNFPRFFPVHLRCSKAEEHWLSPNYRRDVCWFEFWQYPSNAALNAELARFFDRFDSRLHWGKLGSMTPHRLSELYDRWGDFARLRSEWDPGGMFLNERTATWFCRTA
jgi:nucleoside-diphosphate-sugar epimerase